MTRFDDGVYWCARDLADLAIVGNHHFILLVAGANEFEAMDLKPQEEDQVYFVTLAGTKNEDGQLVYSPNDENDVISVREFIDPDEHTNLFAADLDLEPHRVASPEASEPDFMRLVVQLATNYGHNTRNALPAYELIDQNCSAWVNTLFAVAGMTEASRVELGEFFGVDWGEEDLIDMKLFQSAS